MNNLNFLDFCKEKLSPLLPPDLSDFSDVLHSHHFPDSQDLENYSPAPLHYDQSTTEPYDPGDDTLEGFYYEKPRCSSITKSYLPEVPEVPEESKEKETVEILKSVHILGDMNQDMGGSVEFVERKSVIKRTIGCNCKKSHCEKMYCDCLNEGRFCCENCCCKECRNTPRHRGEHKSGKKGKILEDCRSEEGKGKELRGCNCKKSRCKKKYCECFSIGIDCGEECACVDCENKAGRLGNKSRKILKIYSAEEKRVGVVKRRDKGFSSVRKITDWNQHVFSIDEGRKKTGGGLRLFTDIEDLDKDIGDIDKDIGDIEFIGNIDDIGDLEDVEGIDDIREK